MKKNSSRLPLLSLTALGVVFGDIGTSPLYAVRESFSGHFGVSPTPQNILGVLSLISWALILIVSVKYLILVLRADNDGEGGVLALSSLIDPQNGGEAETGRRGRRRAKMILVSIGLFGAALLYGDGMLTPAISVLSAIEGLKVLEPSLERFVVPLTVLVLVGLFLLQRRGTTGVGILFGPVTLVWFLALTALGIRGILLAPEVLAALNPLRGAVFLAQNGLPAFLVLGAVILVVTGAEAIYADMGHFGRRPIRFSWFSLVFPALLINYYGQAALVLSDPSAVQSPFYLLAPSWALVPLIVLATAATVIASQAVITGVFSLTTQAVNLGYWPRLEIRHTSSREYGQIYVPQVNWALLLSTVLLVVAFGSSSALAAAYGIAIVSTMIVTTLLLFVVAPQRWGWSPWLTRLVLLGFLTIELAFFGANIIKVHEGGWVPLLVAGVVYLMMTTWRDGRKMLGKRLEERLMPLPQFVDTLGSRAIVRVPGNAVYMTGNPGMTPSALLMNLEHQKTLHERILVMTVATDRVPHVRGERRVQLDELGKGIHRVIARYGFRETPDVPRILDRLKEKGLELPLSETTFFLGRERLMTTRGPMLGRWRVGLFSFLARNSQRATAFFNIPPDRVVEVGSQIEVEP